MEPIVVTENLWKLYHAGKVEVPALRGVNFEVHLTPNACRELELKPKDEVWLVIKTYSCHLVDRDDLSPAK